MGFLRDVPIKYAYEIVVYFENILKVEYYGFVLDAILFTVWISDFVLDVILKKVWWSH